jgi:hypothetical protein
MVSKNFSTDCVFKTNIMIQAVSVIEEQLRCACFENRKVDYIDSFIEVMRIFN